MDMPGSQASSLREPKREILEERQGSIFQQCLLENIADKQSNSREDETDDCINTSKQKTKKVSEQHQAQSSIRATSNSMVKSTRPISSQLVKALLITIGISLNFLILTEVIHY